MALHVSSLMWGCSHLVPRENLEVKMWSFPVLLTLEKCFDSLVKHPVIVVVLAVKPLLAMTCFPLSIFISVQSKQGKTLNCHTSNQTIHSLHIILTLHIWTSFLLQTSSRCVVVANYKSGLSFVFYNSKFWITSYTHPDLLKYRTQLQRWTKFPLAHWKH